MYVDSEGQGSGNIISVAGQFIPTGRSDPVRSLGRVCDASLTDEHAIQHIRDMTESWLRAIDKSNVIGKLKFWCSQFILIPRLLLTLLIYEVSTSTVVLRKVN